MIARVTIDARDGPGGAFCPSVAGWAVLCDGNGGNDGAESLEASTGAMSARDMPGDRDGI
jgi:hypothetical protein